MNNLSILAKSRSGINGENASEINRAAKREIGSSRNQAINNEITEMLLQLG